MGVLKDLYQSVWEELGGGRANSRTSEAPFAEKLRRETVRHFISKELFNLERMLLLNPQQKDSLFLFHEEDEHAPFDELELIVKNNVSARSHIGKVKECILDLDEISTVASDEITSELHRDELTVSVLNMLRNQTAQVYLLSGDDGNGQAEWFVKQPRSFVQATLLAGDRKENAFNAVCFEKDLSTLDLDCREYLHKPHPTGRWNAIRTEDEFFNRDALKLSKEIRMWEASKKNVTGIEREELERKIARAEKVLSKATATRNSALRDAYRTGEISEYYYRQRTEQLEKSDYSRVPEMFEVDELKNREQYLKSHDLQDLSKEEGDSICALAEKRAKKEKELYLKKEFLTRRGLSHSYRYLVSEMAINKEIFYRGLAAENGLYEVNEKEDEVCQVSIDIDEIGEDYIGMTMRQVPSPGERVRSKKQ